MSLGRRPTIVSMDCFLKHFKVEPSQGMEQGKKIRSKIRGVGHKIWMGDGLGFHWRAFMKPEGNPSEGLELK